MTAPLECAWCGAGEPDVRFLPIRWWPNRRGEVFCSRHHRESSRRALARLVARVEGGAS